MQMYTQEVCIFLQLRVITFIVTYSTLYYFLYHYIKEIIIGLWENNSLLYQLYLSLCVITGFHADLYKNDIHTQTHKLLFSSGLYKHLLTTIIWDHCEGKRIWKQYSVQHNPPWV